MNSLDLSIKDLNGKNYRLLVDRLYDEIIVDKAKIIVKENEIRMILYKKEKREWECLHYKPSVNKTIEKNVKKFRSLKEKTFRTKVI